MNCSRCDRVVTRKNVAGENSKGERLIARAEEIAAGQLIVRIERVIDLANETIDVVRRRRGNEEVRFATVIEERERAIGRRPRITSQQASDNGIRWTTERRDLAWIGDTCS